MLWNAGMAVTSFHCLLFLSFFARVSRTDGRSPLMSKSMTKKAMQVNERALVKKQWWLGEYVMYVDPTVTLTEWFLNVSFLITAVQHQTLQNKLIRHKVDPISAPGDLQHSLTLMTFHRLNTCIYFIMILLLCLLSAWSASAASAQHGLTKRTWQCGSESHLW